MNINEVLYLPAKREGLNIGPDEFYCKRRYRSLDGEEVASSVKAKSKEELLGRQKPEVPQFVAECLEEDKKRNLVPSQYTNEVFEWMKEDNNAFVYLDAWVNGYTVKKEKLYKVRDKRLSPDRNCLNAKKQSGSHSLRGCH